METRNTQSCELVLLIDLFKDKFFFIIFCIILIIFSGSLIGYYFFFGSEEYDSADFLVYCSATKAFFDGKDPFLVSNIQMYFGSSLSFNYLPITIPFFVPFCMGWMKILYYLLYTLFIFLGLFVLLKIDKSFDIFLLFCLVICGFHSTFWNFYEGNVDLLIFLMCCLGFYFIKKNKFNFASMTIGLLSVFKIFPILFLGGFLFSNKSNSKKINFIIVGGSVLLALNLMSFLFFPSLTVSYYEQIFGLKLDQHSPIKEAFGRDTPSLFGLIFNISKYFFDSNIIFSYLLFGFTCICLFVLLYSYSKKEKEFLKVFSMYIIFVLLVIPRLKSYSLVAAIIPTFFLIKDLTYFKKYLFLVIVCLFPFVSYFIHLFYSQVLPLPIIAIFDYSQLLALIAVYLFTFFSKKSNYLGFLEF